MADFIDMWNLQKGIVEMVEFFHRHGESQRSGAAGYISMILGLIYQ
jgi:hypothetical protein